MSQLESHIQYVHAQGTVQLVKNRQPAYINSLQISGYDLSHKSPFIDRLATAITQGADQNIAWLLQTFNPIETSNDTMLLKLYRQEDHDAWKFIDKLQAAVDVVDPTIQYERESIDVIATSNQTIQEYDTYIMTVRN